MSYQVLARKWRPKDFSEVVGQEHVVKALSNALDQNKVPQAYVISGTRGVGKTTIARILSKSLNCEVGLSSTPCHECSTCKSISDGSFMDFQEIDAASSRGVDDTQKLLETVIHMPSSSRYKVYLFDEVHMFSKHSFNMLLKTLEEPPEHVIFILATTEIQKIPQTVLSRCLQFNLKNLLADQLIQRISFILSQEGIDFEEKSISMIAKAGKGSLRDCLTLTDQAIAYCEGSLTVSGLSEMLGTVPDDDVIGLLNSLIKNDTKILFDQLLSISQLDVEYEKLMDSLLEAIQYIAIANFSPDSLVELNFNKEDIIALSQSISADEIQILYQIGLLAKRDMGLAPDLKGGFEMALLRMLAFTPKQVSLSESKKKQTKSSEDVKNNDVLKNSSDENQDNSIQVVLEKKELISNSKVDEIKDDPKLDEDDGFINLNQDSWNNIFKSLELDKGTKQLASHCSFSRIDGSVIYFSMPEDKLDIFSGKHRQKFQESLSLSLEKKCNVFFEIGETSNISPNTTKEKEREQIKIEAEKSIKEDPNVQHLLDAFGANLVDSSIKSRELK
jgi:DNA polymerase-3 subunit gamma/tau